MLRKTDAGKGDRYRTVDFKQWARHYDAIYWGDVSDLPMAICHDCKHRLRCITKNDISCGTYLNHMKIPYGSGTSYGCIISNFFEPLQEVIDD